jgi:capsular polysaccharide transport system ATP-binding protein
MSASRNVAARAAEILRHAALFDRVVKLAGAPPDETVIFAGVSVTVPTDRCMVILGRQETGRTTLLNLLCGRSRPDRGVVASRTKFSMILNAKSYLHPQLTGIQNILLLARMYSLDEDAVVMQAVGLPGLRTGVWDLPVGELDIRPRRSMELLLAALLPYDCYLLDDIDKADLNIAATAIALAKARGAGFIFTTYGVKHARNLADCAGVIANRNLTVFDSVPDAIKFYG